MLRVSVLRPFRFLVHPSRTSLLSLNIQLQSQWHCPGRKNLVSGAGSSFILVTLASAEPAMATSPAGCVEGQLRAHTSGLGKLGDPGPGARARPSADPRALVPAVVRRVPPVCIQPSCLPAVAVQTSPLRAPGVQAPNAKGQEKRPRRGPAGFSPAASFSAEWNGLSSVSPSFLLSFLSLFLARGGSTLCIQPVLCRRSATLHCPIWTA